MQKSSRMLPDGRSSRAHGKPHTPLPLHGAFDLHVGIAAANVSRLRRLCRTAPHGRLPVAALPSVSRPSLSARDCCAAAPHTARQPELSLSGPSPSARLILDKLYRIDYSSALHPFSASGEKLWRSVCVNAGHLNIFVPDSRLEQ